MPPSHRSALAGLVLASATGVLEAICPCKFAGQQLSASIYEDFPSYAPAGCNADSNVNCTKTPGMYKDEPFVRLYGTNCAAWDSVPDTPWNSYCQKPSDKTWDDKDYNWCQQPWCYVDESCPDAVASSVFAGSDVAFYSYLSCGATADCYTDIAWEASPTWPTGCPYDPHGDSSYTVSKSGDCACLYQGSTLAQDIYQNYPSDNPGKYNTNEYQHIEIYGTTCAAWDQLPGTPWFSYCPAGSEWCHPDYNWCQAPWCYVGANCNTGVASSVFAGSDAAQYSYDTCLSTPDCYTDVAWDDDWQTNAPAACPFDSTDNGWTTKKTCPSGWAASITAEGAAKDLPDSICACKFTGALLPASVYDNFPSYDPAGCNDDSSVACTKTPGMYNADPLVKLYGTNCAAWDAVPDTPWNSYCQIPADKSWNDPDYNWCQQPWCYVDESCAGATPSSVFAGSDVAFYSYLSCGASSDCYTGIAWNSSYVWPAGCPYDPHGDSTFKVFKKLDCQCKYHGTTLNAEIYQNYPSDNPGKYNTNDYKHIQVYGTTCAAWDQIPDTPWYSYCPSDSEWCAPDYNWCQEPWCYVSEGCATGVASSVFAGSPTAKYSYDTCLSTPDCYTGVAWDDDWQTNAPAACPFDSTDNGIYTAKKCPNGWVEPAAGTGTTTGGTSTAGTSTGTSTSGTSTGTTTGSTNGTNGTTGSTTGTGALASAAPLGCSSSAAVILLSLSALLFKF